MPRPACWMCRRLIASEGQMHRARSTVKRKPERHAACVAGRAQHDGSPAMPLPRRALFAAGAAALPAAAAFSPARAQQTAERTVRYGISMADVPQTTGQPDRGAGAYQFTGHTIYDPLVAWEMDVADRAGKLVPGLATAWEADPADRRRWIFRLRE